MKRISKIASLILVIAMIFSIASFGLNSNAAAISATKKGASSQSSCSAATLDGSSISMTATIHGWATDFKVYAGDQTSSPASPSGTPVLTQTVSAGAIAGEHTYTGTLSDGGTSTQGYTAIVSGGTAYAYAYFAYTGPSYKMEFHKDGVAVTTAAIGLNGGTVSGYSFVYENGFTYTTSGTSATVTVSGDNFTITPVSVGTTTITAIAGGSTSATFTINVTDDSTLTAQWYDTNEPITANKTFTASSNKSYGFGVDAFPAEDVTVQLSNNTAGAAITESSIEGQYPYTIRGTVPGGSVNVTIKGGSKNITFKVNFTEAAFGIFEDLSFDTEVDPLEGVPSNSSKSFYTNEEVKWVVNTTGGTTYTSTGTSITVAAGNSDTITTVFAAPTDAAEADVDEYNCLDWFDVYVLGEVDTTLGDSVFKVDYGYAYNTAHGVQPTTKTLMKSVPDTQTYKAYVPFREGGLAAGAESVDFDDGTVTLKFKDFQAKFTINSREVIFSDLDGSNSVTETIPSENEVPILETFTNDDGTTMSKTYLPARILSYVPQWTAGEDGGKFIDYVSNTDSNNRGEYVIYTEKSAYGADIEKARATYAGLITEAIKAWGI